MMRKPAHARSRVCFLVANAVRPIAENVRSIWSPRWLVPCPRCSHPKSRLPHPLGSGFQPLLFSKLRRNPCGRPLRLLAPTGAPRQIGSSNRIHREFFEVRSLNLDHLQTLMEVVALGSFSAAARRLNLSQPAVSLQIRELETRCGVRLVERVGKRVLPTAAG